MSNNINNSVQSMNNAWEKFMINNISKIHKWNNNFISLRSNRCDITYTITLYQYFLYQYT